MIDLHAHILPGLDDGPRDLDEAVTLARAAVAAGTRTVAATSHVNRSFRLQPDALAAARTALAERLVEEEVPLAVVQGGEVSTGRLPELGDAELRALTLGGGGWVLLECPFSTTAAMAPMVADLRGRGFGVLLAHPERSAAFQREPVGLAQLVELGALAQVTAGSFAGDFGEVPERAANRMLEGGLLHVLATDAHDAFSRPPDPAAGIAALARRYGDVAAQVAWMTEAAPAAILAGERPPPRPTLPRPRERHPWVRASPAR